MAICWRCGNQFFPNAMTQTCIICGYLPDEQTEKLIRAKKAVHDFLERNPQSDGSDKNYRIKRKCSKD